MTLRRFTHFDAFRCSKVFKKAVFIALMPLLCVNSTLADDAKDNTNIVTDLDYGLVLFHYFQGQHQAALTQLAIIESERDIKHLGVSPELVKGGMSLSYGLYDEANAIFDRVLASDSSREVKSDAWFGSGKLQYLEGNWQGASQAFERAGNAVSIENKDDFFYFKAQLALKENDIERYNNFKSNITPENEFHGYLSHNYLLNKIKAKALTIDDLQVPQIGNDPQSNALADRSYLAMGYAFIERGNHNAAIHAFKKIGLDSYLIEPALLGYGWALNNEGQYGQAKNLFSRLARGRDLNTYVQESILANANTSKLLGDIKDSLQILAGGLVKFEQQKNHLLSMQQQLIKGSDCYRAVVLLQSDMTCDKEGNSFNDLALIALISDSQFSASRQQLQQVNELNREFKQKLEKLMTFEGMLKEKQQVTQARLEHIDIVQLEAKIDAFKAQRKSLVERINVAKSESNSAFFLPQTQLNQHNKIKATLAKLDQLQHSNKKVVSLAQRLDLINRTFLWQSDYNYAANVNKTLEEIKTLDFALNALTAIFQRFSQHVAQVTNINREMTKIAVLRLTITLQRQHSQRIAARIEQDFYTQLSAYFTERHRVLDHNIREAKLAMIQMQDASFKQSQQALLPKQASPQTGKP